MEKKQHAEFMTDIYNLFKESYQQVAEKIVEKYGNDPSIQDFLQGSLAYAFSYTVAHSNTIEQGLKYIENIYTEFKDITREGVCS